MSWHSVTAVEQSLGTYTFLFTDIEGSTKLWEDRRAEMSQALRAHDDLLRKTVEDHGGKVFKTVGDAVFAAFEVATQAAEAALAAQLALEQIDSPLSLRVRMALHTGTVELRDGDYFGPPLNRVARLLSAGYGGQMLLSGATYELVREDLPKGARVVSLGQHRLRDLARPEHVHQLCHPGLDAEFPPLKTLESIPNNLPLQPTSFVGRDKEAAEIRTLLESAPLVTVTGSGGAGKTRCSLQVAADLLDAFPDGAWIVELAALEDQTRVVAALAEVLRVAEHPSTDLMVSVRSRLRDARILLILDNCEHLIAACASLASELLRSCPNVRILATSREPLSVAGEQMYRLPSLGMPAGEEQDIAQLERSESVQLFLDRARAVLPDFRLDSKNAEAVASICRRLDGIPLALELAAARLRSLSAQEVNLRLSDAFRILTGGSRSALPRHQTLRGAIDWSYNMLSEDERAVLCRLTVFAGGWILEDAEKVGTDPAGGFEEWEVLDLLQSLIDKSLVTLESGPESSRYRMLETVRQYAAEKLGDGEEATRKRHAEHFMSLAVQAAKPDSNGAGAALGLRLYRDSENVRSALRWMMWHGDSPLHALIFACSLHRTCLLRWSKREVLGLWEDLLARAAHLPPSPALLDSLAHASWYAGGAGDGKRAMALAEQGIAVAKAVNDPLGEGRILNALGSIHLHNRQLAEAERAFRDAYQAVLPCNYPRANISILTNLGICLQAKGDWEGAANCFAEARPLIGAGSDPVNGPMLDYYEGELLAEQARFEEAAPLFEAALKGAERLEISALMSELCCGAYGWIPALHGDHAEARRRLERGLALATEHGLAESVSRAQIRLAGLEALAGNLDRATSHLGSVRIGDAWPGEQVLVLLAAARVALARGELRDAIRIAGTAIAVRRRDPVPSSPLEQLQTRRLLDDLAVAFGKDVRLESDDELDSESAIALAVKAVQPAVAGASTS